MGKREASELSAGKPTDDEGGGGTALKQITVAWQQANDALQESERRYRELVESSLGLICTHDLKGTILSINPAAASSLGYQPADGIGRSLSEFVHRDKRHLFDDYLRRIEEHGHDSGLMQVVARSGAIRVWMYRNVLSGSPGATYVLGHAIDVTDRVAAERTLRANEEALRQVHADLETRIKERTVALENANEQLRSEIAERAEVERLRQHALARADEANRLKDEFLSTLSHELRTPLNAIVGWVRILRGRSLDPYTAHAVEVIERNAEAQIRLIDEVLDVSRIMAGKMSLAMELVDLGSIVRSTIETLRPMMQIKRVRCDARIAEHLPLVFGDAQRLQQVFWNVLSNAVKFTTNDGGITASLRTLADGIEFEITDTGIGIRPDVLPFVFDRFRQADSSMTRTHGGLGLGLAIVKEIVQLHGGDVRAASGGEGHGATFTIRLPRADTASVEVSTRVAPPHISSVPRLRGRTVLVVEDNDDARELIAAVLGAAGAEVMCASTAIDAINGAAGRRPDLLVTDLGLPGEDGYALLARMRTLHPDVPAMALTAYARASDRDRALAAGFLEYTSKPVDPDRLVDLVATIMSRRSR